MVCVRTFMRMCVSVCVCVDATRIEQLVVTKLRNAFQISFSFLFCSVIVVVVVAVVVVVVLRYVWRLHSNSLCFSFELLLVATNVAFV